MKTIKVLMAGIDFTFAKNVNPQIGDEFLIKQAVATGWARLAKVIKITNKQVELVVINLIPTIESNKLGIHNGYTDRGEGFFEDWQWRKRACIGKTYRFWRKTGVRVGDNNECNPTILAELI